MGSYLGPGGIVSPTQSSLICAIEKSELVSRLLRTLRQNSQPPVDRTDRRARKAVPAQLLGNSFTLRIDTLARTSLAALPSVPAPSADCTRKGVGGPRKAVSLR